MNVNKKSFRMGLITFASPLLRTEKGDTKFGKEIVFENIIEITNKKFSSHNFISQKYLE